MTVQSLLPCVNAALQPQVSFRGATPPPSAPPSLYSLTNGERMADHFIRIASVDTQANDKVTENPSSGGQRTLANLLAEELRTYGLVDVQIDEHSVVTGTLPDNLGLMTKSPTIGFLSHMDTAPDVPSTGTFRPAMTRNYQGGDIQLPFGTVIPASTLAQHVGKDIIHSDGENLLGADDKAGIEAILEALRVFSENPGIKHPRIRVAFTVDEEISTYIHKFSLENFGASAAYTLDGGDPAELESESFNAHQLTVTIKGAEAHPGYAKGKMINALTLAGELLGKFPPHEAPETTSGREGYFFPHTMEGTSGEVKLKINLRDFAPQGNTERLARVKAWVAEVLTAHPGAQITVDSLEQYGNMAEAIAAKPEVLEYAREGLRRGGLTPIEPPIRGGTDGCTLSLGGLPTPNLGTAQWNIHSKQEFTTVQDLRQSAANILNILAVWTENILKGKVTEGSV